jgi:hypothetical protein
VVHTIATFGVTHPWLLLLLRLLLLLLLLLLRLLLLLQGPTMTSFSMCAPRPARPAPTAQPTQCQAVTTKTIVTVSHT